MKSKVGVVCFSILFLAVIFVSVESADEDEDKEITEGGMRLRRQAPMNSVIDNQRRRPGREHGVGRRPGRPQRPGRGQGRGRGRGQGRGRGRGRGRGQGRGRGRGRGRGHGRGHAERPVINEIRPALRRIMDGFIGSQNTFATNLLREVDVENNLIFSPSSIHQALAMTSMGARQTTSLQMKRVLALRGQGNRAHRVNKRLNMILNAPGNATLKVANKVYVKPGLALEQQFSNGLRVFYNSSVSELELDHPDGPEAPINEWVSTQTNSLIPQLLTSGTIDSSTALVLLNAIYFKAKWETPFEVEMTRPTPFHKTPSEDVSVEMMQLEEHFKMGVVPNLDAEVLELPYQGERHSMLVILPTSSSSDRALEEVEENLLGEHLNVNLDTHRKTRVKVFLPRFKIESSMSLKQNLQDMGMVTPFSPEDADFTGISSTGGLYISDVIHKAVVEVTEEGSEAAAATAVIMSESAVFRSSPRAIPEFRCDRPFLFLIRDNMSKVNLFLGRFNGVV